MNTLTTTNLSSFSVTISPDALAQKKDALALAAEVTAVASVSEQQNAIAAASMMKSLVKGMEKTRKEVKEPVLDAGRKIDATAAGYSKELEAEIARVEKLAADFQREENRKAEALRRAEEEKQREEQRLAEEERRKEAEALRKIAEEAAAERRREQEAIAKAADEKARTEAILAAQKAEADRIEHQKILDAECRAQEERRLEEARQRAMDMNLVAAPPKAAGARVRVSFDFTVTDIHALYRARPDLVKLEAKRADILAAISIPGAPAIPGISVFESTKVNAL